jgi:6-pyruvoyltetrahydropterin/6-carboxytetrahydropterin synthase
MFEITKRFSIPVGHRLSKHQGLCKNIHGHNIDVEISVCSEKLNENDMVMDFADLKNLSNRLLNQFDHVLLLNETNDRALYDTLLSYGIKKMILVQFEPTAEKLAEYFYNFMKTNLPDGIDISYVAIYENDTSKALYYE